MNPSSASKPAPAASSAAASAPQQPEQQQQEPQQQQQEPLRYALAIHGGAGVINTSNSVWIERAMEGLQAALEAGHAVLRAGGSAMDAAVASVVVMENDPHFNAGEEERCTFGDPCRQKQQLLVKEQSAVAEPAWTVVTCRASTTSASTRMTRGAIACPGSTTMSKPTKD
jgi:hypothetical protein